MPLPKFLAYNLVSSTPKWTKIVNMNFHAIDMVHTMNFPI